VTRLYPRDPYLERISQIVARATQDTLDIRPNQVKCWIQSWTRSQKELRPGEHAFTEPANALWNGSDGGTQAFRNEQGLEFTFRKEPGAGVTVSIFDPTQGGERWGNRRTGTWSRWFSPGDDNFSHWRKTGLRRREVSINPQTSAPQEQVQSVVETPKFLRFDWAVTPAPGKPTQRLTHTLPLEASSEDSTRRYVIYTQSRDASSKVWVPGRRLVWRFGQEDKVQEIPLPEPS
jgi:hypothetical protein